MKPEYNKKYTTISVYVVITFAVCLSLVAIFLSFDKIAGVVSRIATILAPITWGIVIAYIANPVMKLCERCLKKAICRKKDRSKLLRSISITVGMATVLAILTALIAILLPEIIDSVIDIANNFSTYLDQMQSFFFDLFDKYPEITTFFEEQFNSIEPILTDFANSLIPALGDLAVTLKDGAIGVIISLKDFLIGFIIAVYLLASKEKFIAQMKKVTKAFFPQNIANGLIRISSSANETVNNFFVGKIIDSFIIGVLCFICMSIMKMEFVALISVVIGATNIIPFFGPIIGAIPTSFLLLLAAPKQVIPFVIFILILQQFDGNILGPYILGDSTGLSPVWVMVAIFLGGGLFGFPGMLLGVPVFAVIYTLARDLINFILEKKGLETGTESYITYDEYVPKRKRKVAKHQNFFKLFQKDKKNKTSTIEVVENVYHNIKEVKDDD